MTRHAWLNPTLYPFASHHLDVGPGRMHYVDEGEGVPIVMVHGTPSWSFLYRHLIRGLSADFRCVAPDHLGFGLSDKPEAFAYTPKAHAENLETLIKTLNLKDVVLMVHDFGGPIGLSYALDHPENVRALVIMNTWLWRYRALGQAGRVLGNPLGRFLYERLNFSVSVLLKRVAFADSGVLTDKNSGGTSLSFIPHAKSAGLSAMALRLSHSVSNQALDASMVSMRAKRGLRLLGVGKGPW